MGQLKVLHLAGVNRDTVIGKPCLIRPQEVPTTGKLCVCILPEDLPKVHLTERDLITTLCDSEWECFLNPFEDGTIAYDGEALMHTQKVCS